ncbi:MAG: insulinase family protein [Bacteroidales bacterium]|jgi:predicted Zn-dependent peptidase|nr:insulinase family protein [Bacteroidales bacterium]
MRKTAPVYQEINTIPIIRAERIYLDNGMPLFALKAGTQDIIKITLLFNAGSIYQSAPLVSFAANSLLSEGSRKYTATQISEMNDFHGSYLTCSTDKDFASVTLLTLRKHLDQILPVLEDVVKYPAYPEKEMQSFIARHSQQFLVEEAKTRVIAHRRFLKALFGDEHPYGHELQLSDFQNLDVEQLRRFYSTYYYPANCRIIVSGNVDNKDIQLLNKHLGDDSWQKNTSGILPEYSFSEEQQYHQNIKKEGAVQSSIRIGKQVCNKQHQDFSGLTVLNTLLGGYFGSRLMRNIREDKGYTYGINSLLVSLKKAGYLTIVTDVGIDVVQPALKEIYKEIERLQQDLVPDEELQMVKTHLMSEMLRSFDGPFAQAESLIALLEYDLDENYYEQYIHHIKNIDAKEIQKLSQQYLDVQRIYEVVVG